jgi:glycosyltransferase involved in cell wall biosynthesis
MLLPSETESFGLAALEAMACGVPVMASDAGGLPELIEHGSNGLLVSEEGQAEGIARAVHLLSHAPTAAAFSKAALAASEKYQLSEILNRYQALYRGLLDN